MRKGEASSALFNTIDTQSAGGGLGPSCICCTVAEEEAIRMNASLKTFVARVPWWGKITGKLILAHAPVDYRIWKRLHLFEQGAMEVPTYAYQVFQKHFDQARSLRRLNNWIGLELGPGDSLLSAMVAYAHGASAYYLVDSGEYARAGVQQYRAMAKFLAEQDLSVPNAQYLESVNATLAACQARYGTLGLDSLRAIPDESVDFVWSHTVLQHVRRVEFLETMRELRRILRPDGVSSHWVDLQDCIGGALNNLRFRESVWESPFMADSGFYTNRIRYSEMLALFREAGFQVDVISVKRWDRLPTSRSKLSERFRDLSEEELRVSCFHAVLRPA